METAKFMNVSLKAGKKKWVERIVCVSEKPGYSGYIESNTVFEAPVRWVPKKQAGKNDQNDQTDQNDK